MNQALLKIAEALRSVYRPDKVAHLGIGQGLGDIHCWRQWDVTAATLIDSFQFSPPWLRNELELKSGWTWKSAIISNCSTSGQDFFVASNGAESGLIDPEILRPYWPSLNTLEKISVNTLTLDDCLLPTHPDWLMIDCFPALDILKGGLRVLENLGVIWTRAVFQAEDSRLHHAWLKTISAFLLEHDFHLIAISADTHPDVGHALFARDWKHHLERKLSNASTLELELRENLTKAGDMLARTGTDCDQLTRENADVKERYASLLSDHKLLEERYGSLNAEKCQLDSDLQERSLLVTKLEDQLSCQASELEDYRHRQYLLNEEMLRVDAQIELIKDVLLRDPGP